MTHINASYGFGWLGLSDAWYTLLWASLLCSIFFLWHYRRKGLVVHLAIVATAAMSITLLAPTAKWLVLAFLNANVGASSALAIGLFGIAASLISGYSLYATTAIDRKRDVIDVDIRTLTEMTSRLEEHGRRQDATLLATRQQLEIQQLRMVAFLCTSDELETIDGGGSRLSRNRVMTLRLVQRLLSRPSLSGVIFDLRELVSVLRRHPSLLSGETKVQLQSYVFLLSESVESNEIDQARVAQSLGSMLIA